MNGSQHAKKPVILKPEASGTSLQAKDLGCNRPRTDPRFFHAATASTRFVSETQRNALV